MKKKITWLFATITVAVFSSSCLKDRQVFCNCSQDDIITSVSVLTSGLNNPRGIKFGPDGNLYVAEGGIGGSNSSDGLCSPVLPPVGPYTGSVDGSRISKISASGVRTTVAENLPSSQTAVTQGGSISGVGDIAFIGNTLYGVLAGAGCSHGVPTIPNGVVKVNHDKSWKLTADLSTFQMNNPVQNPFAGDFEPDGTWYSMISVGANLYAIEPNHGELDKITPGGNISRVADISATQGHIVPTTLAFHNGNFYVGNLGVFPITGISSIYKITPAGEVSVVATGFSMITGIAFDAIGGMYVLESTTANPFPTPGTGDVVRIDASGNRSVIVTGLNLPTAITFGPDQKLYISNWGFGAPAGGGEILKVDIKCSNQRTTVQK